MIEKPAYQINASTIIYPESNGEAIADNTRQFRWIMTIQGGLDVVFREREDVFVAGALLWYPVEGEPAICRGPDVMVAFGRPKGDRSSYRQWEEGGVAPQVVFEVLSPNNTRQEMDDKFVFYDHYGVEEYYLYDPDANRLSGWQRVGGRLKAIAAIDGWTSPLLGVRFIIAGGELQIIGLDGLQFLTYVGLQRRAEQALERAGRATQIAYEAEVRAAEARQRADQEQQRADQEQQRVERLMAKLRAMGIEPGTLEDEQI
jgi:Uma2 family endonuclease